MGTPFVQASAFLFAEVAGKVAMDDDSEEVKHQSIQKDDDFLLDCGRELFFVSRCFRAKTKW